MNHVDGWPDRACISSSRHFVLAESRSGPVTQWITDRIAKISGEIDQYPTDPNQHCIQLRGIWVNDAYGGYHVYIDILRDRGSDAPDHDALREHLKNGWADDEGQTRAVFVRTVEVWMLDDHYFPNAPEFYVQLRKDWGWPSRNLPGSNVPYEDP